MIRLSHLEQEILKPYLIACHRAVKWIFANLIESFAGLCLIQCFRKTGRAAAEREGHGDQWHPAAAQLRSDQVCVARIGRCFETLSALS